MIIRPILLVLIVATTASTIGRATIAPPLVCSAMIIFCLTSSVEEKPPFDLGPVNLVVQDGGHDASLQFL
jgi:hypothetical protein